MKPDIESSSTNVVWSPLKGSQTLAISCPCNHIFYEGTRGPGKTDSQLLYFRKYVGIGYGHYWRGVIFDREYKNLDDIVSKSKKWFPKFGDGATWLRSAKDYKWVWPTGEELFFRNVKVEDDYYDYHGQEFPFIGWNELTKYPNPKLYDAMMSCNRSSFLPLEHTPKDEKGNFRTENKEALPEIPLIVFSTSNPYGPGHNWVKAKLIDVALPGEVVRVTTNVFNPRTKQRENVTKTQVRIFGSYKENKYLSPEYIAELENITEPNKRKAWLWGDWDIVAGGAIDDLWDPAIHLIQPFKIPSEWRVDRSFDWGSSHPFSVGFWAEANGEEVVLPSGVVWCPPRGTLIRIGEWYGSKRVGFNEGIKMSAREVALGIVKRQDLLKERGIISGPVWAGPADNQIRNVNEKESESIEVKMSKAGVTWTESDKKPGSRKNGLQLLRDRLEASVKKNSQPGIYFFNTCKATIATLPVLPRDEKDPDDVDTDAEDHAYDDIRYRVLASSNRFATKIPVRRNT